MPAGTSYDSGAPAIEARVHGDAQLPVRERSESDGGCSIASAPIPCFGTE